jgi:hypothetical protein
MSLSYRKFLHIWEESIELPPQNIGPLTPVFKKTAPFFKVTPWKTLIPLSFLLAVVVALLLQLTAVQIASILQKGF